MRVGSLCSGAGGLDMAVEQVFGATTAWHCEIDNAASKVLAHRYPGIPNHRDLINTEWAQVEPIDIMCAGWPCQPWSAAGKKLGAADERAIWPEIDRAICVLRPRVIVLENVPTVVRVGELERVANSLARVGYDMRWTCLRASDIGAPHQRKRLFVIASNSDDLLFRTNTGEMAQWASSRKRCRKEADRRLAGGVKGVGAVGLLPTPTSRDHKGHNQRGDMTCLSGALMPTPKASDASGGKHNSEGHADGSRGQDLARANRDGSGGDDLVTLAVKASRDSQWGRYGEAVARWERVVGPAPAPTEPNTKGNPRLNPAFSEWMMGWPAGWVTDVPGVSRNDQLRIIGNGVVPQQAVAALSWLTSISEVAA